jgi:hypothetical protein
MQEPAWVYFGTDGAAPGFGLTQHNYSRGRGGRGGRAARLSGLLESRSSSAGSEERVACARPPTKSSLDRLHLFDFHLKVATRDRTGNAVLPPPFR